MAMVTKKTKYTNKPLEPLYPLEWEERAYQEILQGFKEIWKLKMVRFLELARENENIAPEERNLPNLQSGSKELVDLYEAIFHQLIFNEPLLYRMLVYVAMTPEDRQGRQAFFERYLKTVNFEAYDDILDIDVLQGSELAGLYKLSGIPVHSCFVGKVLKNLFDEAESRWMTDNGKSELVRFEKTQNGLIIEYLNEADYKDPLADEIIDNILYGMIRKTREDRRKNLFLGSGLDRWEYQIIKRFNGEEKPPIPFHLLPKYAGLIRKWAKIGKEYKGIKRFDGNNPLEEWQDFENEAVRLFMDAVLDQTPRKAKTKTLPFAAFIENQFQWRSGDEWDKQSIQVNGKRISKDHLDHPVASLDAEIDVDDEGVGSLHDITKDTKTLDPEDSLLNREQVVRENKLREYLATTTDKKLIRLIRIHAQKGKEKLTDADQKFYKRNWDNKIKELQEMFNIAI